MIAKYFWIDWKIFILDFATWSESEFKFDEDSVSCLFASDNWQTVIILFVTLLGRLKVIEVSD